MVLKIIAISNGMGGQSQDIAPLLFEHHPLLKEFWENTIILNIFADTGDEEDQMYNLTIPRYQQYLQDNNWQELIIINRHQTHNIPELKMSDYYINHNAMPTRQFRHCTDKFKIQVVRKYLQLFLKKWKLSSNAYIYAYVLFYANIICNLLYVNDPVSHCHLYSLSYFSAA